jgi:membrane protease YdiL (CAAX protease family)
LKQKKDYRLLKLFGIYVSAVLFGLMLAIMFDGCKIYATAFYLVVIFGLYVYIKKENIRWKLWLGRVHRDGIVRIVISAIFMLILILLTVALRTAVWKEGITENFEFDIFVFIGTCCLAPLTEEFICRGIILDILKEKHSHTFAIIASAVIFYIIHGNPMNICSLLFGLFAGWMMIKAKSIIPSVIMHFVWNIIIYFLPVIALNLANTV